jgi:hypothetical protein
LPFPPESPAVNPATIGAQTASSNLTEDILDHGRFAWNKLIDMPWKIMSIGIRDWAYRS